MESANEKYLYYLLSNITPEGKFGLKILAGIADLNRGSFFTVRHFHPTLPKGCSRMHKDKIPALVDEALRSSWNAFQSFRKKTLKERADFLRTIAETLQLEQEELIITANRETNLSMAQLTMELKRTIFQLTSYAKACETGSWLDLRIDTANTERQPPKPDLRKMLVPLGPVVIFGASNFPFAYSTAGGDTACALAAGCTVVLKAHPAHEQTSIMVAAAVQEAAKINELPSSVFIHLEGQGFELGQALVQHPLTSAVGFTGSFEGGRALFDIANRRKVPIPVFAEMGSVNPVFLMPQKLANDTEKIASMFGSSITQGNGQFCTNPGLMIGIESDALNRFVQLLGKIIQNNQPSRMLHPGIAKSFREKRSRSLETNGVTLAASTMIQGAEDESIPSLATVKANDFLQNPVLHEEVFGPFSLLVICKDADEMLQVARSMEGQLTTTLIAEEEEVQLNSELVAVLLQMAGRLILNGVPTGVEVALAMHHGGPFPATTDSRFTAVGADGIKRFARPVCYQNWSNELLPDELKNENPLGLWRTINDKITQDAAIQ